MSAVTVNVEAPEVRSFQAELAQIGSYGRQRVLEAMGAEVRLNLIEHFTELDQDSVHHRWATQLGAASTHFYESAMRGVQLPQVEGDDSVSVSINSEGIAQRYLGGPIEAKNKKWLTIPAIAEAYGKRAGSFNNLQFIPLGPELAALVERTPQSPRQTKVAANGAVVPTEEKSIKGRVFYWLKKSVTQAGDPSVLPTDDEMSARAVAAGQEALAQMNSHSGTGGST